MARPNLTTTQRGYGADHQAVRAQWAPRVVRGEVLCHAVRCLMPTRLIKPGSPWDLGHNVERTHWTGPEHRRCNRSEGATRGNRKRARSRRWTASRRW